MEEADARGESNGDAVAVDGDVLDSAVPEVTVLLMAGWSLEDTAVEDMAVESERLLLADFRWRQGKQEACFAGLDEQADRVSRGDAVGEMCDKDLWFKGQGALGDFLRQDKKGKVFNVLRVGDASC